MADGHNLLDWVDRQPDWARDALRRHAQSGNHEISADDGVAITARVRAAAGATPDKSLDHLPLLASHLTFGPIAGSRSLLCSLGPVENVGRLAADQKLTFALDGITLIYGDNGSGKSGYDPAANAVLTVEQIEELIWEAIRLYHLEIHSGTGMAPGAVWHQDAQRYGIPVHNDLRQLDKMLGTVAEGRQLSRSGIEIHGLRYHDASAVQKLLNDLVGTAPATDQRRSGSGTCRVKVKFNPANLAEIHVWNHRDRRYYTLKCLDERYAQGMSLWHHRKLKEWAKAANLAFATEEDRLAARSRLAAKVEQLIPDVMLRKRRTVARVIKAPTQEPLQGVVEMRFAPSRHDGMAPIIDQTPLAFSRTDDGLASSRPPSRKKSKPAVKRTKKTPAAKPLPPPNSFGTGSNGLDWRGFQ